MRPSSSSRRLMVATRSTSRVRERMSPSHTLARDTRSLTTFAGDSRVVRQQRLGCWIQARRCGTSADGRLDRWYGRRLLRLTPNNRPRMPLAATVRVLLPELQRQQPGQHGYEQPRGVPAQQQRQVRYPVARCRAVHRLLEHQPRLELPGTSIANRPREPILFLFIKRAWQCRSRSRE